MALQTVELDLFLATTSKFVVEVSEPAEEAMVEMQLPYKVFCLVSDIGEGVVYLFMSY